MKRTPLNFNPATESYTVITAKLNGDELGRKTFDNLPDAARSMQERLFCPYVRLRDEATGEILWMVIDGVEEHKVGYIEDALATVTCACGGEVASRLRADGLINECSDCGKVAD